MRLMRAKVLSRRVLFQTERSPFKVPGKTTVFWKLERVRTGVELRDALLKSLTEWKSTLGRVEVGSPNRAASRAVRCVKVPPVDPLFVKYVAGMGR